MTEVAKNKLNRIALVFFSLMLLFGIGIRIYYFCVDRSLWIDEAMFASSIVNRDLSNLTSKPLDYGQSSPFGYLYIVKCITLIMGNTSQALRLLSLLSGFASLGLFYFIGKRILGLKHAFAYTAIFSLLIYFVKYSNDFKPYMFDNMLTMISLILYWLYKTGKMKLWQLCVVFSFILWNSLFCIFVIGACMCCVVFDICKDIYNNKKLTAVHWGQLGCCALVLISVLAYNSCWLSMSADNAGAPDYWKLLSFTQALKTLDLKLFIKFLNMFTQPLLSSSKWHIGYLPLLGVGICFIYMIGKKKNNIFWSVLIVMTVLMLACSSAGCLPMQSRLLQFWTIQAILICCYAFEDIDEIYFKKGLYILIFVCLCYGANLARTINPYVNGSEVTGAFAYLNQNRTDKDTVYIYNASLPAFEFYNGYKRPVYDFEYISNRSDEADKNLIYGKKLHKFHYKIPYSYEFDIVEDILKSEIERIVAKNFVYIFTSYCDDKRPDVVALLEGLRKYGEVKVVVEDHKTFMYHFKSFSTEEGVAQ